MKDRIIMRSLYNIIKYKAILISLICITFTTAAYAVDEKPTAVNTETSPRVALGFNLDLFPTIVSATQEKFGMSFQTWVGINHMRIRFVGAHLYLPEALAGNKYFNQFRTSVGALIVDYCFGKNFDGVWIGSGIEIWQNQITHRQSGLKSEWTNQVLTLGVGYTWRMYKNLYLDPWCAVHYIMNDATIKRNGHSFEQFPLQASVSVKIGYFFNIK